MKPFFVGRMEKEFNKICSLCRKSEKSIYIGTHLNIAK